MALQQKVWVTCVMFTLVMVCRSSDVLSSVSVDGPRDKTAEESRCALSTGTQSTATPASLNDQEAFLAPAEGQRPDSGHPMKNDSDAEREGRDEGDGGSLSIPEGISPRRNQAFGFSGIYGYGIGFPGFVPYMGYGFLGGYPRPYGFGYMFR